MLAVHLQLVAVTLCCVPLLNGHETATRREVFPTSSIRIKEACNHIGNALEGEGCSREDTHGILRGEMLALPGYNWWNDPELEHALHFYDLDRIYDSSYHGKDHVDKPVIEAYAHYALAYCEHLHGRKCTSVLDAGAARCYFSEGMSELGASVLSVEGTAAGYEACDKRGKSKVVRHDLRLPLDLKGRKFDLVTCTEVAEHIEPPFAGTLVHSLTEAADVIWFSSEPPAWVSDNPDHVHHSNEQPDLYWDRLFLFFGFEAIALPDCVVDAVGRRGRRVYYRASSLAFDRSTLQPPVADARSRGEQRVSAGRLFLPSSGPWACVDGDATQSL